MYPEEWIAWVAKPGENPVNKKEKSVGPSNKRCLAGLAADNACSFR